MSIFIIILLLQHWFHVWPLTSRISEKIQNFSAAVASVYWVIISMVRVMSASNSSTCEGSSLASNKPPLCWNIKNEIQSVFCFFSTAFFIISKGKAIPLQPWTGPEGSRRLRLPDFIIVSTAVKSIWMTLLKLKLWSFTLYELVHWTFRDCHVDRRGQDNVADYNGNSVCSISRERVVNTTGSRLEEVNIAGLTPGRTYYFRVVAYSAQGRGLSSDFLEVTTKPEVHVPSPPLKLRVTPTSPTSLLVQWSPPEQSNGDILHYNIFYMEVSVVESS